MPDWTRTGPAFPARYPGECPHPECPHEGVIAKGERIVKLAKPRKRTIRNLEGMQGYRYDRVVRMEYAHVGCTVEKQEREYQGPVCDCGASLVVDGEVMLRCEECDA